MVWSKNRSLFAGDVQEDVEHINHGRPPVDDVSPELASREHMRVAWRRKLPNVEDSGVSWLVGMQI